jgi:hypothetical protein
METFGSISLSFCSSLFQNTLTSEKLTESTSSFNASITSNLLSITIVYNPFLMKVT